VKNRENIKDYIECAQIVYDNIIEDEKNQKQRRLLTNSDIARITSQFVHAFYCGLPNDILTLVEK